MARFIFLLLATFGAFFSWSSEAHASHFRYGTINWRVPDPVNAPRTVEFTVQQAWRTASPDCTELNFGDNTSSSACASVAQIGTGVDAVGQSYIIRQYKTTHTYAGVATSFTTNFNGCCRIAALQNGAGGSFRVESVVSLASGNTGGPVSASPAIRQMQIGATRTLLFPTFDPDGDAVTCRLATDAEAGFTGSVPNVSGNTPTVQTVAGGCQVTWNVTAGVAGRQYVLHIVGDSTHGGAVSSAQLDLILELVTPPPPTCAGGGTFIVDPGMPLMVTTTVTDPGAAAGLTTMNATNDPATSVFLPLKGTALPAPWSSVFTWTPAASDAGTTKVVAVNYTNSINLTGTCFLTIQIPQCANYGAACSTGVGACRRTGTNVCAALNTTVCNAVPGLPSLETCDGVDNNCDGNVDNAPIDANQACSSGLPGACAAGTTVCASGALSCQANVAPGTQTETCDNLDNNCNGQVDEGYNVGSSCSNGVGACAATGTLSCNLAGGASCNAIPHLPAIETCDGVDNNCDGNVDNAPIDAGVMCNSGAPGVCGPGTSVCSAGALSCHSNVAPGSIPETCDGIDNDCDGAADEGFNLGGTCNVGVGACQRSGTLVCNALTGGTSCTAIAGLPMPETCDGIDNDCDGSVDDTPVDVGAICASGAPGICGPGATECHAGALSCHSNVAPGSVAETCDGLDNDCDGTADDGFNLGSTCNAGVGACESSGTLVCNLLTGGTSCTAIPGLPTPEVCDGVDNDCNGATDNTPLDAGLPCPSGVPGVCGAGTTACDAGTLSCEANIQPGELAESCDGLDNDCDGTADDGLGLGDACSSGVGACMATGVQVCDLAGGTMCTAMPGLPLPETCDGVDNDCNGSTDDAPIDAGMVCLSGLPGVCATGMTVCQAGALSCDPDFAPGEEPEMCDLVDNDCDGAVDEGMGLGDACSAGVGACQTTGMMVCDLSGAAVCGALPGLPLPETCDGIDNDCNGSVDDDAIDANVVCATGNPGECAFGISSCNAGQLACNGDLEPGDEPESCDDLLDSDCDGQPSNGCTDDADGDGLTDDEEEAIGTDPDDADSDDDGVPDGLEPEYATDSDGDGLINALDPDSDNDGLFDGTEMGFGCDSPATDASQGHCIADADLGVTKTDPLDADTDDGSVPDGQEDLDRDGVVDPGETNPNDPTDDVDEDSDDDGLTDDFEISIGTDPHDADSDDDGLLDGEEPNPADDTDHDGFINALDPDSDDDRLFDGTEMGRDCSSPATDLAAMHCIADADPTTATSPVDADTDDGGVRDGVEDRNHDGKLDPSETDPTAGHGDDDEANDDADGDGLTNVEEEEAIGTDPNDADSDDDGVADGDEPDRAVDTDGDGLINALDPDSDDDGLFDGTEMGRDCSDLAIDQSAGHCIPDADHGGTTTDPLDADSDDGSVSDGDEDTDHDGAVDPGERDPNDASDDVDGPAVVECTADADCGDAASGRVCDAGSGTCVDGCRAGGNGCPVGQACDSNDNRIGACGIVAPEEEPEPEHDFGSDIDVAGHGVFCAASPAGESNASAWLVIAGLALVVARRRR